MRFGTTELLVILAIAFLFFGPSRLPQIGESMGKTIRAFRKELDGKSVKTVEDTNVEGEKE